jgi:hypothetical protein
VNTLAARIEARSPELASRVLDEMYRNPFWLERFGERGRDFARQDGEFHLAYLVQALAADDPRVLTGYARWLQSVLTTRGMCTLHIDDNFASLARTIADEIADADPAIALLDAARHALRYEAAVPRLVQDHAADSAAAAAVEIYRRHPEWAASAGEAGRRRCREDLCYHLSYLADALALDRPGIFTDYVDWIAGFLARHSVPVAHLRESLHIVGDVVVGQPALAAAAPLVRELIAGATGYLA